MRLSTVRGSECNKKAASLHRKEGSKKVRKVIDHVTNSIPIRLFSSSSLLLSAVQVAKKQDSRSPPSTTSHCSPLRGPVMIIVSGRGVRGNMLSSTKTPLWFTSNKCHVLLSWLHNEDTIVISGWRAKMIHRSVSQQLYSVLAQRLVTMPCYSAFLS